MCDQHLQSRTAVREAKLLPMLVQKLFLVNASEIDARNKPEILQAVYSIIAHDTENQAAFLSLGGISAIREMLDENEETTRLITKIRQIYKPVERIRAAASDPSSARSKKSVQVESRAVEGNEEKIEVSNSTRLIKKAAVSNTSSESHKAAIPTLKEDHTFVISYDEIKIDFSAPLGFGGYGIVYSGRWSTNHVAIKQLQIPHLSKKALDNFYTEAEIHYQFRHPNIVALYGICCAPQGYYMVMARMSCSLASFLREKPVLSELDRYTLAGGITDGVAYLHAKGVIHRDLKSANILLDRDKGLHPTLTDFGLSEVKSDINMHRSTETVSSQTSLAGSPRWMAPELFAGWPFSVLSDIFALGVVFWEIQALLLPFSEETTESIIKMVRGGYRESIPRGTPLVYANLIQGCWQQEPEKRPQQAKLIAGALRLFKAQEIKREEIRHKAKQGLNLSEIEDEILNDTPGFLLG